jgi:hypothetical protein
MPSDPLVSRLWWRRLLRRLSFLTLFAQHVAGRSTCSAANCGTDRTTRRGAYCTTCSSTYRRALLFSTGSLRDAGSSSPTDGCPYWTSDGCADTRSYCFAEVCASGDILAHCIA